MARQRSEKKPELPVPAERRVLPMELHIGDRLVDETGEWEVIVKVKTLYVGLDAWKMAYPPSGGQHR